MGMRTTRRCFALAATALCWLPLQQTQRAAGAASTVVPCPRAPQPVLTRVAEYHLGTFNVSSYVFSCLLARLFNKAGHHAVKLRSDGRALCLTDMARIVTATGLVLANSEAAAGPAGAATGGATSGSLSVLYGVGARLREYISGSLSKVTRTFGRRVPRHAGHPGQCSGKAVTLTGAFTHC